ncbi:MAG TPA: M2 family metallopeptidase [Chlamydiales bacterium]|nr:M2 family metallopeptidase [Chlamydiales bacterium]
MTHPFEKFLEYFVPLYEKKFTQLNKATWLLETTSSNDAADLRADIDTELRILLSEPAGYQKLRSWYESGEIQNPILHRELNCLMRAFKQNQFPKELLEEIAQKEAALTQSYGQFRPVVHGKKLTENEIRSALKTENDVEKRKKTWEASKNIGDVLAPQILELVFLRNTGAKALGYPDYFQMQLELQEVDRAWLLETFETVAEKSAIAYSSMMKEIEKNQMERFGVLQSELGPWAWSEPFCQEDPLDSHELDMLVEDIDIVDVCTSFYDHMGVDVRSILEKSDMFERPGKNQHAFCIHIDRKGDVRTLNNVKPAIKWLETVLHEYGHAIYDRGIDLNLPWVLREPPHMITTEAMALLAGRQAYRVSSLPILIGEMPSHRPLIQKAAKSLTRRQLIFSRWVLVMTAFESALYSNPGQDLNELWWSCVEKYQKIRRPPCREKKHDWATKYHIGLAPVYYFSYLLGEMFASSIQETLKKETGSIEIATKDAGLFLHKKLFSPGNRMNWSDLVQHVTGHRLTPAAWLREFCE